ncbi:MAG TPA: hypothetical protein VKT77_07605 [Chthonomonadaceae bacterium]|nr:hypothetical protein [Chthonomonadaceae bacterium]
MQLQSVTEGIADQASARDYAAPASFVALKEEQRELAAAFAGTVRERRRIKTCQMMLLTGVMPYCALGAITIIVASEWSNALLATTLPLGIIAPLIGLAVWRWRTPIVKSRGHIGGVVGAAGIYAIGPLLDMRGGPLLVWERDQIVASLVSLLPDLTQDNAGMLTADQRVCLRDILSGARTMGARREARLGLRLAVLQALTRIGDAQSLPIVRRLAHGNGLGVAPSPITQEARCCLSLLEQNIAIALSHATLLRASAPQPAGPDSLLRAAAPSTSNACDGLLRAAGEAPE